jgi:hypothetical protein
MQMSVSELSRSRPAAERSQRPGLGAAIGSAFAKVRASLGKAVSFVFTRALLLLVIGFAAGMAWQTYGAVARKTVAGWSPRLAWVAPAASTADGSRDRLRATSVALTAVRQSVDKLATEVDKLQDLSASSANSGEQRSSSKRSQRR